MATQPRSPLGSCLVYPRAQSWAPFYSWSISMTSWMPSLLALQSVCSQTIVWPLRKNNEDEDQRGLQRNLDPLEAWADKWGVHFNPSECQIMQVKRGNSSPKLHLYELMDTVLQNVTKAKYLGVWLSSNIDWDHQIGTVTNKANTSLHFISCNLSGCSRSAREHKVRSLTMPHLQYCCTVWDPHKKRFKDQLEMVNRRAARCLYNKRWRDRAVSPTAILRQLSCRREGTRDLWWPTRSFTARSPSLGIALPHRAGSRDKTTIVN